jgi:hypothetical protein
LFVSLVSTMSADKAAAKVFSSLGRLGKRTRIGRTSLFDLCFGLANAGVGRRVTRFAWHDATNNYVTLTRVAVHEAPRSLLKRGTAYGILTWKGVPEATERRLTSTCKRDWRFATSDPVLIPIDNINNNKQSSASTTTTTAAERQ